MTIAPRICSLTLIATLAVKAPLSAQTAMLEPASATRPAAAGLTLKALEGRSTVSPLVIELTDGNGAAVRGALVSFHLPEDGPTFANGSHVETVPTDAQGLARLSPGAWAHNGQWVALRVTAVNGTDHAGLLVEYKSTGAGDAVATAPLPTAPEAEAPHQTVGQLETGRPASAPTAAAPRREEELDAMVLPTLGHSVASNGPAIRPLTAAALGSIGATPLVSVVTNPKAPSGRSHKTLYLMLGAAAAAAAVGVVLAMHGGSSSASGAAASSGVSVGTPASISIGHP